MDRAQLTHIVRNHGEVLGLRPTTDTDDPVYDTFGKAYRTRGHRFEWFAVDWGGMYVGIWHPPGHPSAPVVVLEKGAQGRVVAASVRQFVQLLASGWFSGDSLLEGLDDAEELRRTKRVIALLAEKHGVVEGTPAAVEASALRDAPDFQALLDDLAGEEPVWEAARPWWHDDPQLAAAVPFVEKGDWAAATAFARHVMASRPHAAFKPVAAGWAEAAGDIDLAVRWYVEGLRLDLAVALLHREGREVQALRVIVEAIEADPQPRPFAMATLEQWFPDQVGGVMLLVDRRVRPWTEALQQMEGLRAGRRLEMSLARCEAWQHWPLGLATFRTTAAEALVDLGRHEEARRMLRDSGTLPDLEPQRVALIERIVQAAEAPSAAGRGTGDPLQGVLDAWQQAEDDERGALAALAGFALVDAGRKAEAWKPLEEAVMNLSHNHADTPRVFALLEELEAEGLAE